MDTPGACIACGADLVGPFRPEITLTCTGEGQEDKVTVHARAWICPGCGLVHWYAHGESLDRLLDLVASDAAPVARPDISYERRMQVLQMLRRVRRM